MRQRIGVLILFLLFVIVSNGKIEIQVDNNNTLFKSANTVYLLEKEVNLEGKKVIIPMGCEIKNEGGFIRNGTLIGNETVLSGKKQVFIDCNLEGSFKNADIEFFKHKRNQDLSKIRNLVINGDCEVEVEENDNPSIAQTINGNNHTITLKWIKFFNGEHAVFNISGQFSLSNIKFKVKDVFVNKQNHRPAIFRTSRNGYNICFSNVEYKGNILFHKIYLDAQYLSSQPSYVNFDNVKLQTDNSTEEYFLLEYIDRSNFYKPKPYKGRIAFKNSFFTTNSDNAYAPISIQMPYKLSYEKCVFQRFSQKKVCSLETVVPEVLFKDCLLINVGFVDNMSYANYIKCNKIQIEKCKISQPLPFRNIDNRMRVLGYSNIEIEDTHFNMNGSKFGFDVFDALKIKNCQFEITIESSFNHGFVVYQEYPNDSLKNKSPYILIDNLTFHKHTPNNKNNTVCILEFDESGDGINLLKNLKIKKLFTVGFGGNQYVQFNRKTDSVKLFLNENIECIEFLRQRWKSF